MSPVRSVPMPHRAAARIRLVLVVAAVVVGAAAFAYLSTLRIPRRPMPRVGTPDAVAVHWDVAHRRHDAASQEARQAVSFHALQTDTVPAEVRIALDQLTPSINDAMALSNDVTPCWWSGGPPSADNATHPLSTLRPFRPLLSVEAKRRALDGDARGAGEAIAVLVRIARTGACVATVSAFHAVATLSIVEQLVEWCLDRGLLDAGAATQIVAVLETTSAEELADPRAMLDGELAILNHTAALLPDIDLDQLGGGMPLLGIELPETRRGFLAEIEQSEAGIRALRTAIALPEAPARWSALRTAAESTDVKTFSGFVIRAAAAAAAFADEVTVQRDRLIDLLRPIAQGDSDPKSMMNAGIPIWAATRLVDTWASVQNAPESEAANPVESGEVAVSEAVGVATDADLADLEPVLLAHIALARTLPRCDLRAPAARGAHDSPFLENSYMSGEGMDAKSSDGLLQIRRLLDALFAAASLALRDGDVSRSIALAAAGVDLVALVASTTLDVSLAAQASFEEAVPLLIELRRRTEGEPDADLRLDVALRRLAGEGTLDADSTKEHADKLLARRSDPFGRASVVARLRTDLASTLARRSTTVAASKRLVDAIDRMPMDELAGLALAAHLAGDSIFSLMGDGFERGGSAERRARLLSALRGVIASTAIAENDEDAGVVLRGWMSQFDDDSATSATPVRPPAWSLPVAEADRRLIDALRHW